jgi:hypothetical protein
MIIQPLLFDAPAPPFLGAGGAFPEYLRDFTWDGRPTLLTETHVEAGGRPLAVPTFVNEFWTRRQRAAHSLHEVSYRACFKPQLPRFFVERLTRPGDVVYDPFMGRGTTPLEAALHGRVPWGVDINPLSRMLAEPRLRPPTADEVAARLQRVPWDTADDGPQDLLVFYHPDTLREITALRAWLAVREAEGTFDAVDAWIRMVAINRLTGHSAGFFSVYTLPPNQAVSVASQRKINADRGQTPPRRHVPDLIMGKTWSLLADCREPTRRTLAGVAGGARLRTAPAAASGLPDASVQLALTSPPFLDVVDYAGDNWLRGWFAGIDPAGVALTVVNRIDAWRAAMTEAFHDLARLLRPGGFVAFEVGEVRAGTVRLEEHVIPCGLAAGLTPVLVLINAQSFTKTAACWGVDNNRKGTNTNRIVLFRR